ncbi:hypothetical protein Catovirus_1_905 [Catovirus CTV1]|uniref:Uncharacterized protein n=1 Tax=Catovirus CTV1 TaxID=1977631 RepID=A0A1V0SAV9_9VIRU|nr:hypothetical protein Catovirus_1_905 [Catovirus CTV1]
MNKKFTFKHLNSFFDDESLNYGIFGKNQARIYKDISTDAFTKTFLDGPANINLRHMFIDYCFYTIYKDIKINLNNKLIENNSYPLYGDENVYLIFKGGTVMNIVFNDVIKKKINALPNKTDSLQRTIVNYGASANSQINIPNYIDYKGNLTNINNITLNDYILDDLASNFKVSDVDFSIYIRCYDNRRYIVLHDIVTKILFVSLQSISNFFDDVYEQVITNTMNVNLNIYKNMTTIDNFDNQNYLEKNEIFNNNVDQVKNCLTVMKTYILDTFLNGNIIPNFDLQIIALMQTTYNIITNENIHYVLNIRKLLLYYETIVVMKYISGKMNNPIAINNQILNVLKNNIDNHINNKKAKLLKNDFYTLQKIIEFLRKIKGKYDPANTNEYNKDLYQPKYETSYVGTSRTVDRYIAQNGIVDPLFLVENDFENSGKLKIIPRYSSMMLAKNDANKQEEVIIIKNEFNTNNNKQDHQAYHYITFNNTIKKERNVYSIHSNFDLARIKLNIVLDNAIKKNNDVQLQSNYKIPTEFLDISIPNFDDHSRRAFINDINHHGLHTLCLHINNNDYFIDSYSPMDLYKDLEFVLFYQNNILPWVDSKYRKRIKRLVVCAFISHDINNDIISPMKDVVLLTNNVLSYLNNKDPNNLFPYHLFTKFIDVKSICPYTANIDLVNAHTYAKYKIEDMLNVFPNDRHDNIIKINDKYKYFDKYLTFLLFWTRLYHSKYRHRQEILSLINKFRNDYLFDSYDINDPNIIDKLFDNYKALLNEVLVNGVVMLSLYEQKSLNIVGGDREYISKYKKKYMLLKKQKY